MSRAYFTFAVLLVACGPTEKFSDLHRDVFAISCSQSSCHGDAKAANMPLDLASAHAALVNVDVDNVAGRAEGWKRVVPNEPDKSFLLLKLDPPVDPKYGDLMPKGRTDANPLDAELVARIRTWIEEGALNE